MKKVKYASKSLMFAILSAPCFVFAQARVNVANGATINLHGGTSSSPIFVVIDNDNPNAISSSNGGHIHSEGQFNKVRWNIGEGTGNYTLPFGENNVDISPLTLSIDNAGSASGAVDFATYGTAQNNLPLPAGVSSIDHANDPNNLIPADGSKVYDRYWFIAPVDYTTTPEGTISFTYLESKKSGDLLNGSPLAAQFYNGGWEVSQFGSDDATGGVSGVPFSDGDFNTIWTLVEFGSPLPIALLNFNAVWGDNQKSHAIIQWSTASEQDNDFFEIERSTNGIDWRVINKTPGAGNSIHTINYEAIDHNPVNGIAYYRLKQVDFDGTTSFSHPVALHRDVDFASISVFPNPAKDQFNFVLAGLQGDVSLTLIDNAGRTLWSDQIHGVINNHAGSVSCNDFAAGLYTLVVRDENNYQSVKILLNK